jgi:hypothetical protein
VLAHLGITASTVAKRLARWFAFETYRVRIPAVADLVWGFFQGFYHTTTPMLGQYSPHTHAGSVIIPHPCWVNTHPSVPPPPSALIPPSRLRRRGSLSSPLSLGKNCTFYPFLPMSHQFLYEFSSSNSTIISMFCWFEFIRSAQTCCNLYFPPCETLSDSLFFWDRRLMLQRKFSASASILL